MHIAGVWDRKELRFYVDGLMTGRAPMTSFKPGLFTFMIGADPPGNNFFPGTIDEVRVSPVARYSNSFRPHRRFAADEDTRLLLHFDEGRGNVLFDSSPLQRHCRANVSRWTPWKVAGPVVAPGPAQTRTD